MRKAIISYLITNEFKPNFLWVAPTYLNGFLINLTGYNSSYVAEFKTVMSEFCELGYFKQEPFNEDLKNYRLTEKGYFELLLK